MVGVNFSRTVSLGVYRRPTFTKPLKYFIKHTNKLKINLSGRTHIYLKTPPPPNVISFVHFMNVVDFKFVHFLVHFPPKMTTTVFKQWFTERSCTIMVLNRHQWRWAKCLGRMIRIFLIFCITPVYVVYN